MYCEFLGEPSNQTVLFLNGAGDVFDFARQYVFADRYRLAVPHLPGTGEESQAPYSLQACVSGALTLMEQIGKPVTLVGFSLGAQLIVPLLCTAPEKISSAVMISPWILKPAAEVRRIARITKLLAPLERSPRYVRRMCALLGLDERQREAMQAYQSRGRRDYTLSVVKGGVDILDYPAFSSLPVPMLALCGEQEPRIMRDSVLELSRRNPNCAARILPGHAHDIPFLRYEEFNGILDEWLTAHAGT